MNFLKLTRLWGWGFLADEQMIWSVFQKQSDLLGISAETSMLHSEKILCDMLSEKILRVHSSVLKCTKAKKLCSSNIFTVNVCKTKIYGNWHRLLTYKLSKYKVT